MKTEPKLATPAAELVFLKPKRLRPRNHETAHVAGNRLLAEAAHDYLCEYRPNHMRSRAKLNARIVELNAALGTDTGIPAASQEVFLRAIKTERRRWDTMWQRIVSLKPEIVDAVILDLEKRMPGRVVRLRPRARCGDRLPPLAG
ncbi:hypothetical protein ACU8M5_10460 [Rhizobium leguminosarum]